MRTLILISAALTGSAAMAADANFQNHLQSTAMVSPAQLYQVEEIKTDFSLGFQSADTESKPESGDADTMKASGTGVFAAGIYNVKGLGLRTGLILNYGTISADNEDNNFNETTNAFEKTESTTDYTETVISPVVAYTVGPVVLGAAIDLTQRQAKPEEGDTSKSTHNTFRPGALFADGPIEAGLAFRSPNNIQAEENDELSVTEPAIVTVHGRYALDKSMAVGGIITNENWKAINEDFLDDRQTVQGTFEMLTGDIKVEGDLGWKSKFWKEKDSVSSISSGNISTMEIGGAAAYAVNKDTNVGGALGYEFGSESNDGTEVSMNELTVAVRGNMSF